MLRRFARVVGWQDDARESQESQRLVPVGHGEAEDSVFIVLNRGEESV